MNYRVFGKGAAAVRHHFAEASLVVALVLDRDVEPREIASVF
jgi:hypothetical protein